MPGLTWEPSAQYQQLADALTKAREDERAHLLSNNPALADVQLGQALKRLYDQHKISDPTQASAAAAAGRVLADAVSSPEIQALADWTSGMAALQLTGQIEQALVYLDRAAKQFVALGQNQNAAATDVSKVYALAILGRYDEAVRVGEGARDVLLAHGDLLAAGKIEQNLGNIHFRRDNYHQAEALYLAAKTRFAAVSDQRELALAEMNLANVRLSLYQFQQASELYEQALARASSAGADMTHALVEGNIGSLALLQGRYDRALDFLERARRHYTALDMPHESAVAELELADAYLELNLAPEASAIYARVAVTFAELGMRAEQARTLAHHGQTCLVMGRLDQAAELLANARALYQDERNEVGIANVALTEAQLAYKRGEYTAAAEAAQAAEARLDAAGAVGRAVFARWLRGESTRLLGQYTLAEELIESALREAEQQALPHISQRCHTSRGLIATQAGDRAAAQEAFGQAAALMEALRAPLPSEEFRTAFITDKLTPYTELTRLCLGETTPNSVAQAFGYVEQARSRALADALGAPIQAQTMPQDSHEKTLHDQLHTLYAELNWFYNQINRPPEDIPRTSAELHALRQAMREREAQAAEIERQLQQRGTAQLPQSEQASITAIQAELGDTTALVEYFFLDDELIAFVITDSQVVAHRGLAREAEIAHAVRQLYFQLDTFRYGATQTRPYVHQLEQRARHYLADLYNLLLRPLEHDLGERRLVVSPSRQLHYVPFHALYDGKEYVLERREVCSTPSASILRYSRQAMQQRSIDRAVLLGIADEQTPRVHEELITISAHFPQARMLLNNSATLAMLQKHAPEADILHLASHAQFRQDNPRFSALRLADGWLTVRDAAALDLRCTLVTLSACETGVNAVAPGDELLGLLRGFFSAGAASLLVSLWAVDDAATAELMADFYAHLRNQQPPGAALRQAQENARQNYTHPFFWAPFVYIGGW